MTPTNDVTMMTELPLLIYSEDRVHGAVFSQMVYLSKAESKVREQMYNDNVDAALMNRYADWVERILRPFVAKIMMLYAAPEKDKAKIREYYKDLTENLLTRLEKFLTENSTTPYFSN